jgi:hypothetical protein
LAASLGKSLPEQQVLVFTQLFANNITLGFTAFRPTKAEFQIGISA